MVGVGQWRLRPRRQDVKAENTLNVGTAVGDDNLNLTRSLHLRARGDRDATVRRVVDAVDVVSARLTQEEEVAIGVDPVGDHVVRGGRAHLKREA